MDFLKKYVWGFIVTTVAFLLALLKIKSYQNSKLVEENDEIQRQLDNAQHNGDLKTFEAIQNSLKNEAQKDLKEKKYQSKLKPNSRIKL